MDTAFQRISLLIIITMILTGCATPITIGVTPTTTLTPTITNITLTPTTDPRKKMPDTIQTCWASNVPSEQLVYPSVPEPFLYRPVDSDLETSEWTSQFDHQSPIYKRDGVIATLGETIKYDDPGMGQLGGAQAYSGSEPYIFFPATTPFIKMKDYKILGYQSRMYETYFFYDGHDGNDFGVTSNDKEYIEEVLAAADGEVVTKKAIGTFGRVIEIYHSQGYITRYAHLASYADGVEVGSQVKAGDKIGVVGGSGVNKAGKLDDNFWAVHLHFSVYRWNADFQRWNLVDPFAWDPSAGPTKADNLEAQKKDPLFKCNGGISFNLWVDGWPRSVSSSSSTSFQNPGNDRYFGGWAGDLPEYPQSSLGDIAFILDGDIWTINPDGSNLQQLTKTGKYLEAVWSPNGEQIAYVAKSDNEPVSDRDTPMEIGLFDVTSQAVTLLMPAELAPPMGDLKFHYVYYDPRWSSDGRTIFYVAFDGTGPGHKVHSIDISSLSRNDFESLSAHHFDFSSQNGQFVTVSYGMGLFIMSTHNPDGSLNNLLIEPTVFPPDPNVIWIGDVKWMHYSNSIAFFAGQGVYSTGSIAIIDSLGNNQMNFLIPEFINFESGLGNGIEVSPDDKYIAFSTFETDPAIYILDLSNGSFSFLAKGSLPNWRHSQIRD